MQIATRSRKRGRLNDSVYLLNSYSFYRAVLLTIQIIYKTVVAVWVNKYQRSCYKLGPCIIPI